MANPAEVRTICVIHGGVDDDSAINRIAKHVVLGALDRGWRVTVLAQQLDVSLRNDVEWLRLYVPPRLHAVQWTSARSAVRWALRGRSFDAVVGWQAQLIGLLDVYNCQYISAAARDHDGFAGYGSVRSAALRVQQELVCILEANRFRRWDQRALMVYSSDLVKQEFESRFPTPHEQAVLENFGPAPAPASHDERRAARRSFGLMDDGPVFAYLGGFDERKGFRELVSQMWSWPEARLLLAGPDFGGRPATLPSNVVVLGHVRDVRTVLAAADALIVPSRFDPFAVVVLEAAATGTPVIVTAEVGAVDAVRRFDAGVVWDRRASLRVLHEQLEADPERFRRGAIAMAADLQVASFRARFLDLVERCVR